MSPKTRKIISIFEPHRYSRVLSLNKEFAKSFVNSSLVLLCPLYPAGEKKSYRFDQIKFGNLISKLSKTQVVIIKRNEEIKKFLRKNLIKDEIIIGMGAGMISKWMRELKFSL